MRLVFVDTETTGLDPTRHVPWDIAIIEEDGTEHVWTWRPNRYDVDVAEPKALEIGRFHQRAPAEYDYDIEAAVVDAVAATLHDTILVGQNPDFDRRMLLEWLGCHGYQPNVHYRTYDLMMMSAGWCFGVAHVAGQLAGEPAAIPADLQQTKWSSYELSKLVGVDPPGDEAHTAVGDARWVRRMWLAMTGADGGS